MARLTPSETRELLVVAEEVDRGVGRQRANKDHRIVISRRYLLDESKKATLAIDALAVHLEMGQVSVHCTSSEVLDEVSDLKFALAGYGEIDEKYQVID